MRGKTFGVQSIGGGFWLQTMIALEYLGIDLNQLINPAFVRNLEESGYLAEARKKVR